THCKPFAAPGSGPTKPLGTCATVSAPAARAAISQADRRRRSGRNVCRGQGKEQAQGPGGRGGMGGTGGTGKTIVVGAVRRKGNVVARVIQNTGAAEIGRFVREVVSHKVSLLCADDHSAYKPLFKEFPLGVGD